MRAHAGLAVAADPARPGTSRISRLRSDPPLVLRPTATGSSDLVPGWEGPGAVRVSLAAAAAGPIGGDEVRLDVEVGTGAALVLRTVSASLALPGPHGDCSRTTITVRVAAGGTFAWLPGPVIAAHRCRHHQITRLDLEPSARLLTREELLLGRHGEGPGEVRQHLRVVRGDRPLHDQEINVDPATSSWASPAVTGGRKAVGSVFVADPAWSDPPAVHAGDDTAVLPLDRTAALVTALAHDALTLRRRLHDRVDVLATVDERALVVG